MSFIKEEKEGQAYLKLQGPLTVYEVGEMREVLIASFGRDIALILDVEDVNECDTAGIQLLISAKKKAEIEKKYFRITGNSDAVRNVAERIGISPRKIMPES